VTITPAVTLGHNPSIEPAAKGKPLSAAHVQTFKQLFEKRMKRAAIIGFVLLLRCACSHAEDCAAKFRIGEFGIPQSDPVIASGALYGTESEPVYMEKKAVTETPEVCRYVYAFDVFRPTLDKDERFLIAGCYGDFNGDNKRDYVLMLRSASDQKIRLQVYIWSIAGYQAIPVQGARQFDAELPIPMCERMPKNRIFVGLENQQFTVKGDVLHYGVYSYFWEGNGLRGILTSD